MRAPSLTSLKRSRNAPESALDVESSKFDWSFIFFDVQIREELTANGITPYEFPLDDESNTELVADNNEANKTLPFAVVGSHEKLKGNRVRVYPWGTVNGKIFDIFTDFM